MPSPSTTTTDSERTNWLPGLVLVVMSGLTLAAWRLLTGVMEQSAADSLHLLPVVILAGGLVMSLLGAILTWSLVNARRRALGLAEDMTAGLRQAQAELRRLALVASRTGNGVVLTDREWRVEWINPGFTRLFGFTLDEVRGRQPLNFMVGPETDRKVLEAIERAAGQGLPFSGEILNYGKDGRRVWVELEIQPMRDDRGRLTGFMSLQLDITGRKHQSQQLREAKEAAEQANLAKSQFFAMMSHEIRTPMNGIMGMASLLLESPLNPDQRESAETIRGSGHALLTIINDILDFSKIESGRLELDRTEFNLHDCVENALDVLVPVVAQKQIELLYEITPDTPGMVRGDATRLRQVLVNFVGNAVKFTDRGEVSLTVRSLPRPGLESDIFFTVKDTGIGISAENMKRLFQPFSQVDSSSTRRFGGTGLGLAICRRLVDMMGGRIGVESEEGRGSTFSFVLPLEEVPTDGGAFKPAGLEDRRVLIVDDNATCRRILTDQLRHLGMQTVAASTPDQALECLHGSQRFDAVLIDQQLAAMDGLTLARAIRALPKCVNLPLVLLALPGRREDRGGVFDVALGKPVNSGQMLDVLLAIFTRHGNGGEQASRAG